MEITVKLDDFWMNNESQENLSDQLHDYVVSDAVRRIYGSIKSKVEETIDKQVKEAIDKTLRRKITYRINKIIETERVKSSQSGRSSDMITLEEYISLEFTNKTGWNSQTDKIERLANKLGDDMKKRYDLMFASQIVSNLNKNGMLKDDVSKLLLD